MKKVLKGVAVGLAAVSVCGMFASCSAKGIERDANTVNIRAYKGGYGTAWISNVVEKFNAAYADEGYKVNLLTPTAALTGAKSQQEMYSKDDWADLYYCGNVGLDSVIDNKDYGTLVHDIEADVYQKPAIKFDGTEESTTIAEKNLLKYNEEITHRNGKRYALMGNLSSGALLVKTKKLSAYGKELPKTTNQMIDCFNAILNGANGVEGSESTNQYPITYLGGDSGYHSHFYNAWVAQYEGADWWENFWAYKNADGSDMTKEQSVALYEADGLEESMVELYKIYDSAYRAQGSQQNTLNTAHTKLMNATYGAVFMADGEWAYNEISVDNANMQDVTIINIPVISALGVKLFADDFANDKAKCEEALAYVIDKTDEGKNAQEIIAAAQADKSWTLSEADVVDVMEARGVFVDRAQGPGSWWVCNKTQNREICNLFLRMMASEDAAKEMATTAHMVSAFSSADTASAIGESQYFKSFMNIVNYPTAHGVWTNATGLRLKKNALEILPSSGYLFTNVLIQEDQTALAKNGAGVYELVGYDAFYTKAQAKLAKDVTQAGVAWDKN